MSVITITGVERVMDRLGRVNEGAKRAILRENEVFAAELENFMKNEAPWTDRTGNARRSLSGSSGVIEDRFEIVLSGGMEYSPFLELSNGGKYRIIRPTVDQFQSRWLPRLQNVLKGL